MMSEEMILDIAMHNSYDVITGISSAEELMESDIGYFIFDPSRGYSMDDIDLVIAYFEDEEDYEKCQKLLQIKQMI